MGAIKLVLRRVSSLAVRKGKTALVCRKGVAAVTLRRYGKIEVGGLRVSFRHPTKSRVRCQGIAKKRARMALRHSAHCRVIGKGVQLCNRK